MVDKPIRLATQKKALFVPCVGFSITMFFVDRNLRYLKERGIDTGPLIVKRAFLRNIHGAAFLIVAIILVYLLQQMSLPQYLKLGMAYYIYWLGSLALSWSLIMYQKDHGIEE